MAITRVRKTSTISWIGKMLRLFTRTSTAESRSPHALDSLPANVHAASWTSIETAVLNMERMKAEDYAVFDARRRRLM